MPALGPKTGHSMKLYRNTGTVAIPTWLLVDEIGDVSIPDLSRGFAELKRRASDFTKNLPSLVQSIGVEFRMHHGMDAVNFDAIQANFFTATAEEWAVMNGDIAVSQSEGLRLPAYVEQFPFDQPLEDVAGHDMRLAVAYFEEPAGTEIDPNWFVVV